MTTAMKDKTEIQTSLTTDAVWDDVRKGSFAVLSYATPNGDPRSSGVMYKAIGSRLYVATDPQSWKARHIGITGRVAVTVPVRRGGLLSLVAPIPPATISFHGMAKVIPAESPRVRSLLSELKALLPDERRASAVVIEITPEARFVTYGLGVSLSNMRDPTVAGARIPVGEE